MIFVITGVCLKIIIKILIDGVIHISIHISQLKKLTYQNLEIHQTHEFRF